MFLASGAMGILTATSCQQTSEWDVIVDFSSALQTCYCSLPIDINGSEHSSTSMSELAFTELIILAEIQGPRVYHEMAKIKRKFSKFSVYFVLRAVTLA